MSTNTKDTDRQLKEKQVEAQKLQCGLIMPISPIDGCSAEHWNEVKSILVDAINSIERYDFDTKIVSEADDIGVIQKRIVQNIYESDIVICDVSAKNPNVMFELGMRLAFDKPTIIIKDDKTDYSFDTSIIEHLEYPRDLRFTSIVEFKKKLASKVVATYKQATSNSEHSTFLKNFGKFKVAKLDEKEVTADEAILQILGDIQVQLTQVKKNQNNNLTIRESDTALNRRLNRYGDTMSPLFDKDQSNSGNRKLEKLGEKAIRQYLQKLNLVSSTQLTEEDLKGLYDFAEQYVKPQEYFSSPTAYQQFIKTLVNIGVFNF